MLNNIVEPESGVTMLNNIVDNIEQCVNNPVLIKPEQVGHFCRVQMNTNNTCSQRHIMLRSIVASVRPVSSEKNATSLTKNNNVRLCLSPPQSLR